MELLGGTGTSAQPLGGSTDRRIATLLALMRPVGSNHPGAVTRTWSREPMARSVPTARLLSAAARRELTVLSLRTAAVLNGTDAEIHRVLAAPVTGGLRSALLAHLRSGTVVRSGPVDTTRRLDVVATAAGVRDLRAIRVGRDGTALVWGSTGDGRCGVVLRIAATSRDAAGGVRRRAQHPPRRDVPEIPRLVAMGTAAGFRWAVETALPGRPPRHVGLALLRQVRDLLLQLAPGAAERPSWQDDLTAIGSHLRHVRPQIDAVANWLDEVSAPLPTVHRHGDLWRGNLLVSAGRLSGVVDWDGAHVAGMPGTDLLQLVATEQRRDGRTLGDVWASRPWDGPGYRTATDGYWEALGMHPDGELLEAVGTAWWAQEVAGTLDRLPERAHDPVWVRRNVTDVLRALAPG